MPTVQASTVPEVKAALLTVMDADATLTGVAHAWGPPPPDRLVHEHIWFGDVDGTGEPAALGNRARHEDYTLEVFVAVRQGGIDEQATETRAWQIVQALDDAVTANPRLEGLGVTASPFQVTVGGFRQRGFPVQDGASWVTEIVRELDCQATLRRV